MAPHGLRPGAQTLTIGPLSGSFAPCHCTEPACAKQCMQEILLQLLQPNVCPACMLLQTRLWVDAECIEGCNSCLCLLPDNRTIVRRRDCGSGLQPALLAWQQPLLQGAAACGRHLLATPCGLRY